MASAAIIINVASPPGKKAMRKIPATIEITPTTTVDEAKKIIAKAARVSDPCRIAIVDPSTKAIIKERFSPLADQKNVIDAKQIYVKDLGPQLNWRTVYLIEYAGPLFIPLLFAGPLRPYIYFNFDTIPSLSPIQQLSCLLLALHFVKRELETIFIHKFSAATMPAVYVIRNSAHYWIFAGLNIAYWVFRPDAVAARPLSTDLEKYLVYAGLALYVFGELANLNAHIVLANLRPAGTTVRGIPKGFGFSWCTTPNYFFEIIAWIGVLLVTRSWATALFIAIAWWILQKWAVVREKRYRKEFPDKYKPKLWPLTPFITLPVRKTK